MHFRRWVSSLLAVSVLVSCSSGGSDNSSSTSARTAESSGMVSSTHGFPFANFGAANTDEYMDGEDLRAMFGDGVCTNGASKPCTPNSEAAAWAQMVNQSRQAGHCEGMVVQAINRFTTKATPLTSKLSNEADTTHGIIRAFATQFFPKVKDESNKWAKKSLSDIVSVLQESFAKKNITYTMGLYSDMGGHAVLPLSIEYPTESTAKVFIYDTNWPGADRYVLFDLDAQTWEFSFSGQDPANDPAVWKGGKGDIDLASMESRLTTDAPFETGNNGVLGNFLVIRSASLDWSIDTADGIVSPTATTNTSSVRPLRSAGSQSIPEYVVYTDSADITLTLPSESSVYAISSNKIVSILSNGSDEEIAIAQDSVALPKSAEVSVASDNLATTVRGGAATVSIEPTSLSVTATGLPKPIVVNETKPQVTVSITSSGATTATGSAITKPFPSLPTSLIPPDTKSGLPPQDVRTLSAALETSTTSTSSTVATSTSVGSNASPTTTVKTSTPTPSATTAPTTSVSQNNIVALQYVTSQFTATNGQQLPTLSFRLINSSNQWASTASGTCSIALLPEFDNGSLNGASLSGSTSASANGNGTCSFSSVTINGTSGVKYRLRASLNGSGATTTLMAFMLN
ncbi:MAG: hypothetical protein RLZ67_118 [Actinomycetota bacterium]